MMYIPPVVFSAAQAQHCSTFRVPPLDGSILINEIIDWHMKWSKDHQFGVVLGEKDEPNGSVTYAQLGEAVHALGYYFLDAIPEGPRDAEGKPRIVAIFAGMDDLAYCTTILALSRAGFRPFPLSPRNSLPVLVHLMSATSCHHLIGTTPSPDHPATSLETITQGVLTELESSQHSFQLLRPSRPVEVFPHLYAPGILGSLETEKRLLPALHPIPFSSETSDWPWMLLHSSGSTTFPKPIQISQRLGLQMLMWPWMGETDISNKVLGSMAVPSFHALGIIMHICGPFTSGAKATFFKPTEHSKIPTISSLLEAVIKSESNIVTALPSFLEEWSHDPVAMEVLSQMDLVTYSGGPLSKEAGDRLVTAGINLQSMYGTTETGLLFTYFPRVPLGKDWEYGTFCVHLKPRLIPDGDGNVVLQLLECETSNPALLNLPGERGYDIRDLLREHPTKKGYYKIVGRVDDQIMMANGEKTNPGPLEIIINANPLVRGAIMFGRGRIQVGVAVEPAQPVDISNPAELEIFRNAIWPSVEEANAFAPSYSRIFKEYILVLDKPFPRTGKGTVQRQAALRGLEAKINAIYDDLDRTVTADWAQPPISWDEKGIRAFVNRVIHGAVGSDREKGSKVDPERDLFSQGCDSLRATCIRRALMNALRKTPQTASGTTETRDLASSINMNFVFEHPTQKAIETFIVQLVLGVVDAAATPSTEEQHVEAMFAMCSKYTANLIAHKPLAGVEPINGEVVLITGTTGSLGTYLLARLLQDPRVSRVYALNRAGKGSLLQRQEEACKDRGVDASLLQNDKLRLVVGETSEKSLGVGDVLYAEIRDSVTSIIHNAWRLDFNLSLASFEPHVHGVRNLVDMALASSHTIPPQILFTSSISTMLNWQHDRRIPEESFDDPSFAVGGGYGESKWVSERILVTASKETDLRTTIFRIGQLAGSQVNGAWSITDWVPRIVQTGRILHTLPTFSQDTPVTWLPIDVAADTITDVLFVPTPGTRYLHIVNPEVARWDDLFRAFASATSKPQQPAIRLVPYMEWFTALEAHLEEPGAMERIPALRFLDFLRKGVLASSGPPTSTKEAMGATLLDTEKSKSISASLRKARPLDASDVLEWVEYWGKHGLFD